MIQIQKFTFNRWVTRGECESIDDARKFAAEKLLTVPGHGKRIRYVLADGRILGFHDVARGAR